MVSEKKDPLFVLEWDRKIRPVSRQYIEDLT